MGFWHLDKEDRTFKNDLSGGRRRRSKMVVNRNTTLPLPKWLTHLKYVIQFTENSAVTVRAK